MIKGDDKEMKIEIKKRNEKIYYHTKFLKRII